MQKQAYLLFFYLYLPTSIIVGQQDPNQLYYIQQYKDIAIQQMQQTGIPASITLSQALLESGAGQSELARMANNHFGMKCNNNWQGSTYQKKDDDVDLYGNLTFSCFRGYPTVEASFQDHANYLSDPQQAGRYGMLFSLGNTDYQSWAYGLKLAGYATSETYPIRLIGIIERYQLNQYDLVFSNSEKIASTVFMPFTTTTNQVSQVIASGFETASDIAYRTRVPIEKLLTYNEGLVDGYVLSQGEKVYLEPKRNAFYGPLQYHQVGDKETVYDISQRYGIRLKKLLDRNRLEPNQEPETGQWLKLSGWKVKTPPVLSEVASIFDQNKLEEGKILPASILYYTVIKNDTLWSIARRFNTNVEQLKLLNHLNNHIIQRGMQLRVQ